MIMRSVRIVGAFAMGLVLTCGWVSLAGTADALKGTFLQKSAFGELALTFDGKNKFTVGIDGKIFVEGKYKVTKDEIEFTDETGPFAKKDDEKTGTYKWKQADNKLTFTQVKDKAEGRSKALTAAPWELKKK